MNFAEFIEAYNSGKVHDYAQWRAYDIPSSAAERHAVEALKVLGYKKINRLTFGDAAVAFGIPHATAARHLLGMWYVWQQLDLGKRVQGLILREGHDDGYA